MGHMVNSNNTFLDFYKGKRVLVTGDTGFKGSWLSLWLHDLGAEVWGYALAPQENAHFSSLQLQNLIHHIDGDICDYAHLSKVFNDFEPEIVFHLAAQPLVRLSYQDPKSTFDTNIGGSVNLLEIARNCKSLKSIIYVTSDKCYRNKEWIWGYRENDELGGKDPYSASKAAAEIVFQSYLDCFFKELKVGLASVRAGNVIGGGDWADDRIVPDCMRALYDNNPIKIRNPKATRPWQHVLEPLMGYLLLAKQLYNNPLQYSGSWNFGPNNESVHNVGELAKKIINFWGCGCIEIDEQCHQMPEAGLLHLNCDKAHHLLNWKPKWDFTQTIAETVSWYKKYNQKEAHIIEVTRQQLIKYQEVNHD